MPNIQKIIFCNSINDKVKRYADKYMARPNIIKATKNDD